MYSVFLHISVISLIEILFYFYYIGPLESQIFEKSFDHAISELNLDEFDSIITIPDLNQSKLLTMESIILQELNDEVDEANEKKDLYNKNLMMETLFIWGLFTTCIIPIYILQNYYKKYIKNKVDDINYDLNSSDEEIEMILFKRLRKSSIDETDNQNEYNDNVKLLNNIKKNKNNKLIQNLIQYFFLGGGIVLFQYLFFNYVILKYHILTNKEIQYTILKNFFPKFNKILMN